MPSNLGVGKPCNSGCPVESSTEGGEGHYSTRTVNKPQEKVGVAPPPPVCLERGRRPIAAKVWHTPQRVGQGHFPMQTLCKKGLQLQQVGRAV
jgi:hypothetical protein